MSATNSQRLVSYRRFHSLLNLTQWGQRLVDSLGCVIIHVIGLSTSSSSLQLDIDLAMTSAEWCSVVHAEI